VTVAKAIPLFIPGPIEKLNSAVWVIMNFDLYSFSEVLVGHSVFAASAGGEVTYTGQVRLTEAGLSPN
jgi:hypothetical protein